MNDDAVRALAAAIEHLARSLDEAMRASASGTGGIRIHVTGFPTMYQVSPGGGGAGGGG